MTLLSSNKYILRGLYALTVLVFTFSQVKAQEESIDHVAVKLNAIEKSKGYTDFLQIPATNLPPYKDFDENNGNHTIAKTHHRIDKQIGREIIATTETPRTAALEDFKDNQKVALQTDLEPITPEIENEELVKEPNITTIGQTAKQDTFSQVWLGSVLFIVGIVLGLFFGRSGFILSLIGLIFISIGVFIF